MPESWDSFGTSNIGDSFNIELLKKEVGQRFPYYDIRYTPNSIAFFCNIEKESLEEKFDSLRRSLSEKGFIPMLRYEKGENIIYIIKKPKRKEKPIWVNYLLLIATIITTIITGSILVQGYFDVWNMPNPIEILSPDNLLKGAFLFAFPLMSILIIHEMGHYFTSKKYGIKTSLPFFMPIPPVVPGFNIGTFGAVISSRDPMPNKKALFDIGISGPIAGFLVAIPVTIIGIASSNVIPAAEITSGETVLGSSLIFTILSDLILDIPPGSALNMSPIAFAGWVGLLITSINLLPAGQLDGGHIFRSVLGKYQRYASWIAIFIMIFTGWWFFAFIIIFVFGTMHPPPLDDDTELDMKRRLFFVVALAMLILCYIPFPIYVNP